MPCRITVITRDNIFNGLKRGFGCVCCVLGTQSCPTLCDTTDCSLPGFSVRGILQTRILKWERSQDGGGIGREDHFLFYKFIERTIERWTKFAKQLLIASGGHQAPRKAAHCLRREVGQGYWRLKRETRERGTETRPGKGVLLEEVSNHQETLALAGLGEVFKSQRAT